jgi:hypothetical protein
VTLINTPQVWQIDPASHSAELVHEFPHAISAMGIAEYADDVFAIVSNSLAPDIKVENSHCTLEYRQLQRRHRHSHHWELEHLDS